MEAPMSRLLTLALIGLLAVILLPVSANAQGSEEVRYYHTDAIGSVRLVTDTNGQIVERYDYLPFGEPWTASPTGTETRRFGGKERDTETAFDYFGARYYSSVHGRFNVVDPALDTDAATLNPQRWNRYAYGANNPFRNVDPDGRDTVDLMLGFAEGIGKNLVGTVTGIVTTPYALLTDFRGTVNAATAAASDHVRLLSVGVHNPSLVWEAYSGLATSSNDADQRALGAIIGGATATVELAVAGRAASTAERGAAASPAAVTLNRAKGNAFRDEIATALRKSGAEVQVEVVKKTPFGPRVLDLEVSRNGKVLGGIETKKGPNARYTPSQRAKDCWLELCEGYRVDVVREP
jgi:RHS repeat-associated protein